MTEHDIHQTIRRIVLAAAQRVLEDLQRERTPDTDQPEPTHQRPPRAD